MTGLICPKELFASAESWLQGASHSHVKPLCMLRVYLCAQPAIGATARTLPPSETSTALALAHEPYTLDITSIRTCNSRPGSNATRHATEPICVLAFDHKFTLLDLQLCRGPCCDGLVPRIGIYRVSHRVDNKAGSPRGGASRATQHRKTQVSAALQT